MKRIFFILIIFVLLLIGSIGGLWESLVALKPGLVLIFILAIYLLVIEIKKKWQDLLRFNETKVKAEIEAEGLSYPDIRNKLGPFKNLLAILEGNSILDTLVENPIYPILLAEIERAKKSLEYLSGEKEK